MAKKKVTRKELLKETDEFLTTSARIAIFIREHSQQFTYLGVAVAAIALIYLGVTTYLGYINKKGQGIYNEAYYSLVKNITPDGDKKVLKQSEELFQKVVDEYGISKVARLALPEIAYLKFTEKKYDEAISLYDKFLNELPEESPYRSLAKIALAGCYEQKKDFQNATEILKQIMNGPDDFFKEQAMFQLARIYRLTNQKEKSRKILEQFLEKFKSSPFLPIVKAHLE